MEVEYDEDVKPEMETQVGGLGLPPYNQLI